MHKLRGREMYPLKTILLSIYRHKRRNIISCLLLLSVMSAAFCGFFYHDYAQEKCKNVSERYTDRCYISFRDELQYNPRLPHLSALDSRLNGISSTDGIPDVYFDADAMEAYNHPYPASLEMFQNLGNSEYCADYEIVYAENAYGFAEDLPDPMLEILNVLYSSHETNDIPDKILTEHIVVGGNPEVFTAIARERTSGYLYDFILLEGSEEPGPGECVITDFCADIYRKNIGDTIVLNDVYGNPIAELKIAGIYGVYATERYEFVNPQIPRSGRKLTGSDITLDYTGSPDIGTPFDRLGEDLTAHKYSQEHYFGEYFRIEGAMLGLIHTDLETAYNLYGTSETDPEYEERHHINNFFVSYHLKDSGDTAAFEEEMKTIFPESFGEEFTVYPFDNSYDTFIRIPQNLQQTADHLILISCILTALLCVIVSFISVRENGRETGIFLSLGISEKDIIVKTASETTVIMLAAAVTSSCCGRLVHSFLANGYTYLEMNGAEYSVQWSGILFSAGAVLVNFILTAVFTCIYIHIHSPMKLMRQE